jgi:ribosomal protein S18 acetylase RimI-like enzyme
MLVSTSATSNARSPQSFTPLWRLSADLYWIAVHPAARGLGIGHTLLARVEAEVGARGGRLLLIKTSDTPAYTSARRLYESSGYRREAIVHDFYAPGDSLLIFAMELGLFQFPREILRETQQSPAISWMKN